MLATCGINKGLLPKIQGTHFTCRGLPSKGPRSQSKPSQVLMKGGQASTTHGAEGEKTQADLGCDPSGESQRQGGLGTVTDGVTDAHNSHCGAANQPTPGGTDAGSLGADIRVAALMPGGSGMEARGWVADAHEAGG